MASSATRSPDAEVEPVAHFTLKMGRRDREQVCAPYVTTRACEDGGMRIPPSLFLIGLVVAVAILLIKPPRLTCVLPCEWIG